VTDLAYDFKYVSLLTRFITLSNPPQPPLIIIIITIIIVVVVVIVIIIIVIVVVCQQRVSILRHWPEAEAGSRSKRGRGGVLGRLCFGAAVAHGAASTKQPVATWFTRPERDQQERATNRAERKSILA
jgi:hypothetical protein